MENIDTYLAEVSKKEKDLAELKNKMLTDLRDAAKKLGYVLVKRGETSAATGNGGTRIDGEIGRLLNDGPKTEQELIKALTPKHTDDKVKATLKKYIGKRWQITSGKYQKK